MVILALCRNTSSHPTGSNYSRSLETLITEDSLISVPVFRYTVSGVLELVLRFLGKAQFYFPNTNTDLPQTFNRFNIRMDFYAEYSQRCLSRLRNRNVSAVYKPQHSESLNKATCVAELVDAVESVCESVLQVLFRHHLQG